MLSRVCLSAACVVSTLVALSLFHCRCLQRQCPRTTSGHILYHFERDLCIKRDFSQYCNMHFRILTRRHAPTGHPHRTRTPRHAPRMRMRQHATLRRATLDRREHAPHSIRRETTLERYRHRCRFRIRCVPIQVRAMHSVPVWESVIDCSPVSHRLARRTSRDLW